ncbi:MAG: chromosomal replication initiator protein DnaA [Actinomycetota bacterium]|nr:chromosomal replication initiator protein DnaA [Actinomycetota bacterium]MDP3631117.1 chromosomal replication initiator protein DnaA [Actinomycetota bacterium]
MPEVQDVQQVWADTLDVVRLELNTPTFKTWFENTSPLGVIDDMLVVSVQNEFARDWLESRYSGLLASALAQVLGRPMSVSFRVGVDGSVVIESPVVSETRGMPDLEEVEQKRVREASEGDFNPKYTFESFVMGTSNQFAYHAALAVAETPGGAYNPLFIYGGVGLGKTHLLQSIGHYVKMSFPHMKVKYVSSEQFTNDFINSIGDRDKSRIDGFRRQYRTNDVLLVDDIQFLAGKEQTQEEFFHTFNTLQQAGKQIVLSSDGPPKDIGSLEDRLRSRFEMGLITDIQPPELETRIAILRRKVEAEGLAVPDEILSFIADRISSNIRELEGALIRIVAFSSLTRHTIDLDLARSVLKDIFPERSIKPITVSTIQQEVCKFYGIAKNDLVGNKRSQSIVYPRQVAMYLARELTDLSLPRIGAEFGGRDHTTVMHATAKIQKLLNAQREVYNQIQTLTNLVKQRS